MLNVLPLASSLQSTEQVASLVAKFDALLAARGIACRMLSTDAVVAPDLLLILTGGTERLALDVIPRMRPPYFLLAHPDQNSLPAALEILGRLQQLGEKGRVFLLSDRAVPDATLGFLPAILTARRSLASARIARVGEPSDWLVASRPDTSQVTTTWGPTVVDIPMAEVLEAMDAVPHEDVVREAAEITGGATACVEPTPADIEAASRVSVAMRRVIQRHRVDACTVRCFDLLSDRRTTGCLALSGLLDEDVVAGCEGDVPATLTMMWARALAGAYGFMANPQDLDPPTRTVWLAHCTVARRLTSSYALRSHFESSIGVGIQGRLDPGDATVLRIGGSDLRQLFAENGTIEANEDSPVRCRTQVRVRLDGSVEALLSRPSGNHHILIRGQHADRFRAYHDLLIA